MFAATPPLVEDLEVSGLAFAVGFVVAVDLVVAADFALASDFVLTADFAFATGFVLAADFAFAAGFVLAADFALTADAFAGFVEIFPLAFFAFAMRLSVSEVAAVYPSVATWVSSVPPAADTSQARAALR